MKRSEFTRQMMHLENIREMSYEAESSRHKRELEREYDSIIETLEPWIMGRIKFEED